MIPLKLNRSQDELSPETQKQRSNFRLKLLKRLGNQVPIWKHYVEGSSQLHVHILSFGRNTAFAHCVQIRHVSNPLTDVGVGVESTGENDEIPVLVRIVEVGQDPRPVASLARLILPDHCDVWLADSFEAGLPPSLEALWVALNRKLQPSCPVTCGLDSGVVPGQREDEVVQGAPKVVGELADTNGDLVRYRNDSQLAPLGVQQLLKSLRLDIGADFLRVKFEGLDQPMEVRQVFACPVVPKEGV